MQALILIVHVLVAVSVVTLVLIQHGKGADVGAAFGSGSANTMFGSQGHMPFLMKLTSVLAAIFFATSLTLSYLASHSGKQGVTLLNGGVEQQQTAPMTPSIPSSIPSKKTKE